MVSWNLAVFVVPHPLPVVFDVVVAVAAEVGVPYATWNDSAAPLLPYPAVAVEEAAAVVVVAVVRMNRSLHVSIAWHMVVRVVRVVLAAVESSVVVASSPFLVLVLVLLPVQMNSRLPSQQVTQDIRLPSPVVIILQLRCFVARMVPFGGCS